MLAFIAICAVLTVSSPVSALKFSLLGNPDGGQANGGQNCAICTVVVALVEQISEVNNQSVDTALEKLCSLLPSGLLQDACHAFIATYGPEIINGLFNNETPDVVCTQIKLCNGVCHVFPAPPEGIEVAMARAIAQRSQKIKDLPPICNIPGIKELCDWINNFANNHEPLADDDGDFYSQVHTFRGADWRGKDCNDNDASIHPGAIPIDWDVEVDSNCNGIVGRNPATGVPYEQEYCGATPPKGIAVLGDSASAHFHVPPQYLEPANYHNHTFDDILEILEDEFDWPMFSATTGFETSTSAYYPSIDGPTNSSYQYLVNNINPCAFRDFQNIAVNGARSGSMNESIKYSLARNPKTDQPLVAVLALIGNDVCNGHADTIASMTTPQEMYANTMGTLEYLNTVLPVGSTVILMGLANGSVLYEAMANRIHPIGEWHQDVTYTDLYNYLNCLEISPCSGWMNSNATLRYLTTQRAVNLSLVLQEITQNTTFSNFNLMYTDNPLQQAIDMWTSQGGQVWQLIEPVDGFHPNQYAQPLVTQVFIEWMQQNAPDLYGPVNPFLDIIHEQFGNQGGY